MNQTLRFTLLAYGITWLAVLPLVLDSLGVTSLGVSPHWHGFGALGPVVAAFIMSRSGDRRFRIRDLYRRRTSPRIGRGWVAALVATPVILLGVAVICTWVIDGSLGQLAPEALVSPLWIAELVIAAVFYGFGEEPGWRGWLLPHLQQSRGAVRATLLVAVIWAAWHTPFFFYRFDFDGLGTISGFFIAMLAGAFWLTFVFNSTGGSVLAVALWHMLWNAANLVAMPSRTAVQVLNLLMIVLGYGVLLAWGRRGLTVTGSVVVPPANPSLHNT